MRERKGEEGGRKTERERVMRERGKDKDRDV
jgi:hypothetical protein